MSNPVLALIAVIAISFVSLVGLVAYQGNRPAIVQSVRLIAVDGDTVKDGNGTSYRLAGIDAPETRQAKSPQEKEHGLRAKARLGELLSSGRVEVIPETKRGREKYNRTLATIKVNGVDVGGILIKEGLARPYNGGKRQPWVY